MDDRYLYKAKRIDNGTWVEGNLVYSRDAVDAFRAVIIPQCNSDMYTARDERSLGFEHWNKVDGTTVCQCTGLKDKNGDLIWENDIVRFSLSGELGMFEYREDIASFTVCNLKKTRTSFVEDWKDKTDVEVICNLFDIEKVWHEG